MTFFQKCIHSKALIALIAVLILYTLSGFFMAPYLVSRLAPDMVAEKLQRELRMGPVKINPFLFSFQAADVGLYETDGTLIAGFRQCFADFELSSLFQWALVLKTVRLDEPVANAIFDEEGILNFARLTPEKPPAEPAGRAMPQETTEAELPRLLIKHIKITEGNISFTDQRQSVPAMVTLHPLDIELYDISTLPDREGPYSLTATTPQGESFQWTGEITVQPFRSRGHLSFSDIHLSSVWQFFGDHMAVDNPEGRFDFSAAYEIDLGQTEPTIRLNDLDFSLAELGLQLPEDASPLLKLSRLNIKAPLVDVARQTVKVEKVLFEDGKTELVLDENGRLNWSRFAADSRAGDPAFEAAVSGADTAVRPDHSETAWNIQVSEVALRDIQFQYQDQSRDPMLHAGVNDIDGTFQLGLVSGSAGTDLQVKKVSFGFSDIQIGNPNTPEPELRLEKWLFTDGSYDLGRNALAIENMIFQNGSINILRENDGRLNLVTLFSPTGAVAEKAPASPGDSGGSPLQFLIGAAELANFNINFSDRTVMPEGEILHLDNLHATAASIDGKSRMPVNFSFDIREGGRVEVQGRFDPAGTSAMADIDISTLALSPFEPYLKPQASLEVASGTFSIQGQFDYRGKENQPLVLFRGALDVADLEILELESDKTLLGWKHFLTPDFTFQLQPNRLEVSDLKLSGLDGEFIIFEDGSFNLAQAFKREAVKPEKKDPEDGSKPTGSLFPVYIDVLRVENGVLFFADNTLRPRFATKIHQLDGSIVNMSSEPGARAKVKLDGRVDDYGMSKIKGEIDIFDPSAYLDMAVIFRNLEMNRLTPYSGKFVGRRIDSGKLSLDLKYFVENDKFQGDNQILVERLKLGEKIDSPKAVSLPLDLAIAILEDDEGVIDLALPVSGDLSDPDFEYGKLAWEAFVNLITKIATSPFRALGAMLGVDSEKLDAIVFEDGLAELLPPEIEKLTHLAKALEKRPNLKLLVQGGYSEKKDGKALRAIQLKRVIAERQGLKLTPGEDPGVLDFGNPATQSVMEAVFTERYGAKALDEVKTAADQAQPKTGEPATASSQGVTDQDPANFWKTLYRRMVVDEPLAESALVQLGDDRSRAIVRELVETRGVPEDRVAVKKTKSMKPGSSARSRLRLEVLKAKQGKDPSS